MQIQQTHSNSIDHTYHIIYCIIDYLNLLHYSFFVNQRYKNSGATAKSEVLGSKFVKAKYHKGNYLAKISQKEHERVNKENYF